MRVDKLQLKIDDDEVQDLRRRVEGFRAPDPGPGGDSWDYGLPLGFAEKLQKYWLEKFDWTVAEEKINSLRHFRAILGKEFLGIGLHFVFALPKEDQGKLPILLIHGWPGSFWEFHDVIPRLVEAGYPVIAPSLPGYGFSDPPQDRGWSVLRVAAALDALMKGLGYSRYYAQGGDWGGAICRVLGSRPQQFGCVALHLNFFPCGKPKDFDMSTLDAEDKARLERARNFQNSGTGYQAIQRTRPQTLAYGLTDSPMGLACWIAEKFSAWADTGGSRDPTDAISMDDMLTNICIYWFTYSIASSTRLYYETFGLGEHAPVRYEKVPVPCALAAFPEEISHMPLPWVRSTFNVQRYTAFDKGGHFAALERPAELAADMIAFFDTKPKMEPSAARPKL